MDNHELATFIDHTLLKPDTDSASVAQLCKEADEHGFCSVCVLPVFVAQSAQDLQESEVKVCTVIGFPLGANETEVKVAETQLALSRGADEIDMVMNVSALKSGKVDEVLNDIKAVVDAAAGYVVKVILETCLLSDDEKEQACRLCVEAGASFVKTSTGFSHAGATIEDVKLMRRIVGKDLGVKASGEVRDRETAMEMISAGATRLGTSSGLIIVSNDSAPANGDY